MAKLKKTQNLPNIHWNENEHSHVWKLIVEISAKANYKVLFGKKDQHENTSGKTKASIYKRIGAIVLPECYEIDPTATSDCVKSKLESFWKQCSVYFSTAPSEHPAVWAMSSSEAPFPYRPIWYSVTPN
ncbi:uncharacterized protein EDB91DRAFT_1253050 [Suillus paluster]|uniref:uncharacterized protein n=1 Tax=Suillus paluster TaxID=48578 RepID=UPI001B885855|nr:uncharacterized protein EDB91DRAFT_1253050 [Suillus paluster]KAG1729307.1 hypothetical protein EDB91DRAFT_1253050 [Suillus paluster]